MVMSRSEILALLSAQAVLLPALLGATLAQAAFWCWVSAERQCRGYRHGYGEAALSLKLANGRTEAVAATPH